MLKNLRITNKGRQKIWEQKTSSYVEARRFDVEFWRRAGAQARFEAAWQMIGDSFKISGKNVPKLRLRRSIQNIEWLPD
jgi:hypothetical protein